LRTKNTNALVIDTLQNSDFRGDVTFTSGSIVPQNITTSQRDALGNVLNGKIIYNTTLDEWQGYKPTGWSSLGTGTGSGTMLDVNAGQGLLKSGPANSPTLQVDSSRYITAYRNALNIKYQDTLTTIASKYDVSLRVLKSTGLNGSPWFLPIGDFSQTRSIIPDSSGTNNPLLTQSKLNVEKRRLDSLEQRRVGSSATGTHLAYFVNNDSIANGGVWTNAATDTIPRMQDVRNASLLVSGLVPMASIATGTQSNQTFVNGLSQLAVPSLSFQYNSSVVGLYSAVNFTGSGVSVSAGSGVVSVNITGGSGGGGSSVSDTTIQVYRGLFGYHLQIDTMLVLGARSYSMTMATWAWNFPTLPTMGSTSSIPTYGTYAKRDTVFVVRQDSTVKAEGYNLFIKPTVLSAVTNVLAAANDTTRINLSWTKSTHPSVDSNMVRWSTTAYPTTNTTGTLYKSYQKDTVSIRMIGMPVNQLVYISVFPKTVLDEYGSVSSTSQDTARTWAGTSGGGSASSGTAEDSIRNNAWDLAAYANDNTGNSATLNISGFSSLGHANSSLVGGQHFVGNQFPADAGYQFFHGNNPSIPATAVIDSARMYFQFMHNTTELDTLWLQAYNVDTVTAFTGSEGVMARRINPLVADSVRWIIPGAQSDSTYITSPDVAPIIRRVIPNASGLGRATYKNGGIGIVLRKEIYSAMTHYMMFGDYSGAGYRPTRIKIWWHVP
jgi:hypothetical protein